MPVAADHLYIYIVTSVVSHFGLFVKFDWNIIFIA